MPRSDRELYYLLRHDPEKGLEAIMEEYTGLVYTIVYGKLSSVGTRQDAEECVGDVFLALWHARESLDPERGSIRAYLATIAKREAIDTYRRLAAPSRRIRTEAEALDEATELADETDVVAAYIERESKDALLRAVKALGEPDSEIIIRKYYFGETSKTIGRALHMRENTVNKRLSRALAKLKDTIGGILS